LIAEVGVGRRKLLGQRIRRELKTVGAMLQIYCSDRHNTKLGDCPHCAKLLLYATKRLEQCPFGEEKATCASCTVHCYKPELREHIRVVMRFAGPRMLLRHPILAMHHMFDSRREPPLLPKRAGRGSKAP
jgi:hypothetical protein